MQIIAFEYKNWVNFDDKLVNWYLYNGEVLILDSTSNLCNTRSGLKKLKGSFGAVDACRQIKFCQVHCAKTSCWQPEKLPLHV